MLRIFLALIAISAFSNFASANDDLKQNCVLQDDRGETPETSCMLEQAMVNAAVKGLTPLPMKKYCADNADRGKADGTVQKIGYACRGLVRYQDAEGVLSENIFEEWFILPEKTAYRGLFVRGEEGAYRVFWQDPDISGGVPVEASKIFVNYNNPRQSEMMISYHGKDSYYPRFDIHYAYMSTEVYATHGLYEYSADKVNLLKYQPILAASGETLEKKANGDFVIDVEKEIHALTYIQIK